MGSRESGIKMHTAKFVGSWYAMYSLAQRNEIKFVGMEECLPGAHLAHARHATVVLSILTLTPDLLQGTTLCWAATRLRRMAQPLFPRRVMGNGLTSLWLCTTKKIGAPERDGDTGASAFGHNPTMAARPPSRQTLHILNKTTAVPLITSAVAPAKRGSLPRHHSPQQSVSSRPMSKCRT